MNKDKFPEKVLTIFNNNLNKVKTFNEDNIIAYEMNVFLPYKEIKEKDIINLTGYNLCFENNMDRVKLKVRELKLKATMQGIGWGATTNVVEMIFFKDSLIKGTSFYQDVQKFIEKYNDYIEEDKENNIEKIKNIFLKTKLITEDPTHDYIEKIYKKKDHSEDSFQQEPNIMIFGAEDDNTH